MLFPTFLVTFRWGYRRSQSGLGLAQCSIRHTHLALTAQRVGDFLLRGLPRMLWSPSSFEGKGKRGVHGTGHQFQQLLLHSVICRRCGARENRYSHLFRFFGTCAILALVTKDVNRGGASSRWQLNSRLWRCFARMLMRMKSGCAS